MSTFPNRKLRLIWPLLLFIYLFFNPIQLFANSDSAQKAYEIGLMKEGYTIKGDSLFDQKGSSCAISDHQAEKCIHSKKVLRKEDLEHFKPGKSLIIAFVLVLLLLIIFLLVRRRSRIRIRSRKRLR